MDIIEYVKFKPRTTVSSIVQDLEKTRTESNSILYKLERLGLLESEKTKSKPLWSISDSFESNMAIIKQIESTMGTASEIAEKMDMEKSRINSILTNGAEIFGWSKNGAVWFKP